MVSNVISAKHPNLAAGASFTQWYKLQQRWGERMEDIVHGEIYSFCNDWTAGACYLTIIHWGRVTHIRVSKISIIGLENGLHLVGIIWTNAGLLSIGSLGTNVSEISITILIFSFMKMHLKIPCEMVTILSRPQFVKLGNGRVITSYKTLWDVIVYLCPIFWKIIA